VARNIGLVALACCCLSGLVASNAAAGIAIPCPELLGSYEADPYPPFGRNGAFLPGTLFSSITSVTVHWTGTNNAGIVADSTSSQQSQWKARFVLTLGHPTAGVWKAGGAWSNGAFDEILQFTYFGYGTGSLNELLDGRAGVTADLRAPDLAPNTYSVSYPAGTRTGCELLVDGVVPIESVTWGAVKDLYRCQPAATEGQLFHHACHRGPT
jgi:hypothetical protein